MKKLSSGPEGVTHKNLDLMDFQDVYPTGTGSSSSFHLGHHPSPKPLGQGDTDKFQTHAQVKQCVYPERNATFTKIEHRGAHCNPLFEEKNKRHAKLKWPR